ncbi:MAG: phosphoglycolate phosphatase, bacterial [Hyphococcus sp.]|nr:MAG: phosphoglycolate phosphatase, bacterial [Marinicaulis sp.]
MARELAGAAVLFDLDGTLIDTAGDLAASMNQALKVMGLSSVPHADVRHLVGFGARRMLQQGIELSAGRAASENELDDGLAVFLDHYHQNIAVHSRPFDGAIEVIERLKDKGAAIAICTNKREASARLLIDALGVSSLFDVIVGGDTAAYAKPDPAPVQLCLDETKADRAVFIGDSDTDIKAANAARLPCLIAQFGYGPLDHIDAASALFSEYSEAGALIVRMLSERP